MIARKTNRAPHETGMRDHILVYFSGFSYPAGGGLAGPSSYGIYRKVTLFGATSPTFSAARKRYRKSSEPVKRT
jgi:hypothetical protein